MILCTNPELGRIWDRLLSDPRMPDDDSIVALPRPQQVFYLVFNWDCECQNGGFGHFIRSHSGNFLHQTTDALLAIGSIRSALWITRFQDLLGVTLRSDHFQRNEQLGERDISEFDELADRASDLVDAEFGLSDYETDERNLIEYAAKTGLLTSDERLRGLAVLEK